jgi:hypothetical protein
MKKKKNKKIGRTTGMTELLLLEINEKNEGKLIKEKDLKKYKNRMFSNYIQK